MGSPERRPCDGCDRVPDELADVAQILVLAETGEDWRLVKTARKRLIEMARNREGA